MPEELNRRIRALERHGAIPLLGQLGRGIEKESLRVAADGHLAQTPHPAALGSTLTHPQITIDFSESQLELITGVHDSAQAALDELRLVHREVYSALPEEILWTSSMPCMIRGDEQVPIGQFGSSNQGMMKTVYRRGLGNRYGRLMQTISGIHYNFSVPEALWPILQKIDGDDGSLLDFQTAGYFNLIRNFRRYSWLLIYLFGASPAVCRTFVAGREHALESFGAGTLHLPHATSLRMGRLGYQSDAQANLNVSYNSLEAYASTLFEALTGSYAPYEHIGLADENGDYQQLNTALLQIENEFYGTIRPKRTTATGERPLRALRERGVEYVEVRCIDLNPFEPLGIDATQIHFMDAFLIACLLADSQPDSVQENHSMASNQTRVVNDGRNPELLLECNGEQRSLRSWGEEMIEHTRVAAILLDRACGGLEHEHAVDAQLRKIADDTLTPSGQIMGQLDEENMPFFRFAMDQSIATGEHFRDDALSAEEAERAKHKAEASLARQAEIEAGESGTFEEYRANFLRPDQLLTSATPDKRTG